jgi:hypothetical protein
LFILEIVELKKGLAEVTNTIAVVVRTLKSFSTTTRGETYWQTLLKDELIKKWDSLPTHVLNRPDPSDNFIRAFPNFPTGDWEKTYYLPIRELLELALVYSDLPNEFYTFWVDNNDHSAQPNQKRDFVETILYSVISSVLFCLKKVKLTIQAYRGTFGGTFFALHAYI